MMHGGDVYMHGGACSKNTTNRVSIGLQPFLAFEALIVIYIVSPKGDDCPLHFPSGTFSRPPTGGKYPAVQSGGYLYLYSKSNF